MVDMQRIVAAGDPRSRLVVELVSVLRSGAHDLVTVQGPAGSGKSWLVDRVLSHMDGTLPVRRSRFTQLDQGGFASLWSLVAYRPNPLGVRATSFGVDAAAVAALSEALLDECPDGATVVIEDLHWADDMARSALQLLIERTRSINSRFGFLISFRDEMAELLADVTSEVSLFEASVSPLAEDEVHALVLSLGFDRVDPQLVEMLLRVSNGNALHVLEGTRELIDDGSLKVVGGRLTGAPDVVAALPTELSSIVARRLDRVPDPTVIAAASLLGPQADYRSISQLVDGSETLDLTLETAVHLGLLDVANGIYRCRNQLIAQAAFDRLTGNAMSELCGRAAAEAAERSGDPAEIAQHLLAAGQSASPSLLERYGLAGVEALIATGAWGAAGRLGDIIRTASVSTAATDLASGLAHHKNADPERALTAYSAAERHAEADGDLELLVTARCWSARSAAFSHQLTVPASLAAELLRTMQIEGVAKSPRLLVILHASAAEILASAGLIEEAVTEAEAGVAAAGEDDELLASACSSLGIALLSTLKLDRADEYLRQSRRHAEVAGDKTLQVVAGARTAWLSIARGELDAAEEGLVADGDLILRHGSWAERCLVAAAWCALALARGDLDELALQGERAIRLVRRSEYYLGPFLVFPTLIAGAHAEGDHERAWDLLDLWFETGQSGQSTARLLTRIEESLPSVGRELADRPPARRWVGDPNFANTFGLAMTLEVAARSGVAGSDFEHLVAVAEGTMFSDMRLVPTFPSTPTMVLADSLLAMGDGNGAAAHYAAAVHFASNIGAPLVQARALLGEATARSSEEPERLAAARAALVIAERLGAKGIAARATLLLSTDDTDRSMSLDGSTPLALVLTDVVSSTAIADLHGDRVYVEIIEQHDRLMRAELRRFGGQEFEHTGDGICAWFSDPGVAFACGRSIQRSFGRTFGGVRLDVRTAVVFGECYFRRGRPYGGLCNLAARACAEASPGSLVVTDEVRQRSDRSLPLQPLPMVPLKGLSSPPQLFELRS